MTKSDIRDMARNFCGENCLCHDGPMRGHKSCGDVWRHARIAAKELALLKSLCHAPHKHIQAAEARAEAAEAALAALRAALERIAKSNLHDMNTLHPSGCARVAREALSATPPDAVKAPQEPTGEGNENAS